MNLQKKRKYAVSKYKESPKIKVMDCFFAGTAVRPYVSDELPFTPLVFNTTMCIQNLACVQQGYAQSQRIGNKIALCRIDWRFKLNQTSVGQKDVDYYRFCIVYDRNTNGAYPGYSDIFSNLDQTGGLDGGNVDTFINPNNEDRFEIVYDKTFPVQGNDSGTNLSLGPTESSNFLLEGSVELNCLETLFSGSTLNFYGALEIESVLTGGLYLVCLGDNSSGNEAWSGFGNTRLYFTDC